MGNYIFGKNTIANALAHNDSIKELYMVPSFQDERINKLLKQNKVKVIKKSNSEINALVGNVNHQGIVALCDEYKYLTLKQMISKLEHKENPLIVLLDGLEDPHNLGAILRSVDAFGADGVIIGVNRQVRLNSTVAKVSAGATTYVKVARVNNIVDSIRKLKDAGLWVIGTDGDAETMYYNQDLKGPLAIVIGSEGFGMGKLVKENADILIKIPMKGEITSLNASVSAGIVIYEAVRQRM